MGFNYAPPPTALAPKGLIVGGTINALGDSISALGTYYPAGMSLASVPGWVASTAYALGSLVQKSGLVYRCAVAGTSGATGPAGQSQSSVADGGVSWNFVPYYVNRSGSHFLHWVEQFSGGALKWNMSQGYVGVQGSMVRTIVVAGGSGYAQGETVAWANGARGALNVSGGVVTSVTITNPGNSAATGFGAPTITTASGSGVALSNVSQVAGTFGVPGSVTADMVARLPDCTASDVDIFVVHGGTNDLGAGVSFSTITGNLKTCYETLVGAGKRVIAVPILPRGTSTDLTAAQIQTMLRVNRWIRAYARRETWANPSRVIVSLADPTRFWTDGASVLNKPVGAAAATNGAMTSDGLHPSPRGAQYMALAVIAAVQEFKASPPAAYPRPASLADGYHPALNPGGNYLEGQPWSASTNVALGELRSNGGNVYICIQAGATAASGGPSGTSAGQSDNGAKWNYLRVSGGSVFASGTKSAPASSGGYTISGVLDKGWSLYNAGGGAATGAIVCAIESPWSDGQAGQRQSVAFNFSAGTPAELWELYCISSVWQSTDYGNFGILQADLGVTPFVFEVELELSNLANVTQAATIVHDNISAYAYRHQTGAGAFAGSSSSLTLMRSSSEMATVPNGGKLFLRSEPLIFPAPPVTLSNLTMGILFGFDPSTSAASLTAKVNYAAFRRHGVA